MAKGFLSLGSLSSFGCLAAVDVLQVFTGAGTTVCFQGFASELGSLKQRNSFKKKHLHFYMESVFFFFFLRSAPGNSAQDNRGG